jgi:hypothetical protein
MLTVVVGQVQHSLCGVANGGDIIPTHHDRRADLRAFLLADLAKKGDGITAIASDLRERSIRETGSPRPFGARDDGGGVIVGLDFRYRAGRGRTITSNDKKPARERSDEH